MASAPATMPPPGSATMTREVEAPLLLDASSQPRGKMSEQVPGRSFLSEVVSILTFPICFPCGIFTLGPREEAVTVHCGIYTGKYTEPGLHYAHCCGLEVRRLSTARQTHDMPTQRLTDVNGSPIVVSCVITYRFVDPVTALLDVRDPQGYVITQATSAIKTTIAKYSYDQLKRETDLISNEMVRVLQPLVTPAGAEVFTVTLNELNYAPEMAAALLQKQTAQATVEARHLIVQGAVDIATGAISQLEEAGMKFGDEEKFQLVSNLLLVTTSGGGGNGLNMHMHTPKGL